MNSNEYAAKLPNATLRNYPLERCDSSLSTPMAGEAPSDLAATSRDLLALSRQRLERQRQRRRKGYGMLFDHAPIVNGQYPAVCASVPAIAPGPISAKARSHAGSQDGEGDEVDSDIDAMTDSTGELTVAQRGIFRRAALIRASRRFLGFELLTDVSSAPMRGSRSEAPGAWVHNRREAFDVPALSPDSAERERQISSPDDSIQLLTPPYRDPTTNLTRPSRPPLRRGMTYFPLLLDHPPSLSALLTSKEYKESSGDGSLPLDPPSRSNTRSADRKGIADFGGAWSRVKDLWGGSSDKRLRASLV